MALRLSFWQNALMNPEPGKSLTTDAGLLKVSASTMLWMLGISAFLSLMADAIWTECLQREGGFLRVGLGLFIIVACVSKLAFPRAR